MALMKIANTVSKMTKQLLINGVNMLDPRAIGLKCIFSFDGIDGHLTVAGLLESVSITGRFKCLHSGLFYEYCRIAQGDVTAYYGKEQPVPDNVPIKIWGHNVKGKDILSQDAAWDTRYCIAYQVQEMPVEHPLADLANKQEPLGAEFQKVIDDNFEELVEATPVEQENNEYCLVCDMYGEGAIKHHHDQHTEEEASRDSLDIFLRTEMGVRVGGQTIKKLQKHFKIYPRGDK